MSKVITFSRFFPATHPRKGEPTYFVEKMWASLGLKFNEKEQYPIYPALNGFDIRSVNSREVYYKTCDMVHHSFKHRNQIPKHHTIRAGRGRKVGDIFSPRVWSEKPYSSKQIIFAPDIEIKQIYDINIDLHGIMYINSYKWNRPYDEIATNDGLSNQEFIDWIIKPAVKNKGFDGQIICWNDKIQY